MPRSSHQKEAKVTPGSASLPTIGDANSSKKVPPVHNKERITAAPSADVSMLMKEDTDSSKGIPSVSNKEKNKFIPDSAYSCRPTVADVNSSKTAPPLLNLEKNKATPSSGPPDICLTDGAATDWKDDNGLMTAQVSEITHTAEATRTVEETIVAAEVRIPALVATQPIQHPDAGTLPEETAILQAARGLGGDFVSRECRK